MITTQQLPTKNALTSFVDSVEDFPIAAQELVALAENEGTSRPVIDFFGNFPPDQVFSDYDDLAARSEQVLIMQEEEPLMPKEQLLGPQE